jgi:cyclophilin family peptidyl-prolyl cis-trans isomerase
LDIAFYHEKIRCLVDNPDKEDVQLAIEMNRVWQARVAECERLADEAAARGDQEGAAKREPDADAVVRLVFELYPEECPRTCTNFLRLCQDGGLCVTQTGEREPDTATRIKTQAVYKGTYAHQLLPGFIIKFGDVESSSGLHNTKSALGTGRWFQDECLKIPHDSAGMLTAVNNGANSAGTMFAITLDDGSRKKLDSRHVCFGKAVEGFQEFERQCRKCLISGAGVLSSCVVIADCGRLE